MRTFFATTPTGGVYEVVVQKAKEGMVVYITLGQPKYGFKVSAGSKQQQEKLASIQALYQRAKTLFVGLNATHKQLVMA